MGTVYETWGTTMPGELSNSDGGQCDFHPQVVCACGNCEGEELKCEGKPYESKCILTCELCAVAEQSRQLSLTLN